MGQEPQGPKPVIESNDNYALLHELRWHVVIALANGECATVNPHHDRICAGNDGLVGYVGREDIQVETIFCDTCCPKDGCLLWAVVPEFGSVEWRRPAFMNYGWSPTEPSDRRSCIRNSKIHAKSGGDHAANRAAVRHNDRLVRGRNQRRTCDYGAISK